MLSNPDFDLPLFFQCKLDYSRIWSNSMKQKQKLVLIAEAINFEKCTDEKAAYTILSDLQ